MYRLFTALSQLRRKGLGSSGTARSCGIWTSLLKSALLPQSEDFHTLPSSAALNHSLQSVWTSLLRKSALLPQSEDLRTLPSSAALNHSLQSGNPFGAARSKLSCTSTAEGFGSVLSILSGKAVTDHLISQVTYLITRSLVCVSVYQGDELLALLPGTIIRSDGVVATSASRLSFLKSKELQAKVNVEVLNRKATYEAALLDADFCSNIAFIKIMSPVQQQIPRFGKLDYAFQGSEAVAVGISRGRGLPEADSHYYPVFMGPTVKEIKNEQSDARTSGQVIYARVEGSGSVIGGPLVNPHVGVVGVIHYEDNRQIKATPIHEVLKCLERLEKYGEQDPKSDACA